MDSFLKKSTFQSECEDPNDDTSDTLVVPTTKSKNLGFGVEGVNDVASSLAESPFQHILKVYRQTTVLSKSIMRNDNPFKKHLKKVSPLIYHCDKRQFDRFCQWIVLRNQF